MRPSLPELWKPEFQQPVAIQVQQVAQLVERPIEVVEYQRLALSVTDRHTAAWPQTIVPGQDWSEFTSPTRALGNYGHLSYEKQQELMPELGDIDIGVLCKLPMRGNGS